jgi:hypothetical protein
VTAIAVPIRAAMNIQGGSRVPRSRAPTSDTAKLTKATEITGHRQDRGHVVVLTDDRVPGDVPDLVARAAERQKVDEEDEREANRVEEPPDRATSASGRT